MIWSRPVRAHAPFSLISGTAQRETLYSLSVQNGCICETQQLADGTIIAQTTTNGFGQVVVQAQPNTLGGFICTRSEYNAKGQLVKTWADIGLDTTPSAPTRYNAAGQPLISVQKRLISQLSPTLESKSVFVSERGLTSTQWTEYSAGTKRLQYSTVPSSAITAETVKADGVVLSQKDTTGITTAATRPLAIQKGRSRFSAPARLAKQGFRSQVYSRLGGWLLKLIFMCTPYVYANV